MSSADVPSYMMAVYIIVPFVVCLAVIGVVLLLCCSRRYRLNWYERSLLDASSRSDVDSEKAFLHPPGSDSKSKFRRNNIQIRHPHFDDNLPPITVGHGSTLVVTKKVKPQQDVDAGSMGSASSSPTSPDHSPMSSLSEHLSEKRISFSTVLPPVISASNGTRRDTIHCTFPTGGISTQTRRDSSTLSTGSTEVRRDSAEFWVPPTVLQKKRAQSMVPTLELYQEKDYPEDPPEASPGLSPGGPVPAEMIFTYSPEKLSESVSMVQVPAGQRRRRASMQDALDPTTINARMYEQMIKSRHETIGSIQEENLGSLNISLRYNPEQGLLIVRLIQARDLSPQDFSGTSDPYCRLCLLPNRKFQLQSRVHKNTMNPEFEEEFMFDAQQHNINTRVLEILMYDFDQFSRDECMGQVLLPMEHIDLSEEVVLWKGIAPYDRKEEIVDRGDMMFSLGYLSSAERLTVVVLKARNLRFTDEAKGMPNPFVKVSLISNNKRIKKKKTTTKRSMAFPVWNEALAFNISKAILKHLTIELVIFNDSLIGNNEVLGKVVIGPDSSGDELSHYNDMLNSKNAMARWHHVNFSTT